MTSPATRDLKRDPLSTRVVTEGPTQDTGGRGTTDLDAFSARGPVAEAVVTATPRTNPRGRTP